MKWCTFNFGKQREGGRDVGGVGGGGQKCIVMPLHERCHFHNLVLNLSINVKQIK